MWKIGCGDNSRHTEQLVLTWLIPNSNYNFQFIAMLNRQHPIEFLRFNACGSVDDDKSSKAVMEDRKKAGCF